MAHLGEFTINTNGEYVKLSEATGLTFEDGKQYTFQILNAATILSATTAPSKGGFYICKPELNLFTKKAGEDFYIKTMFSGCTLNISE